MNTNAELIRARLKINEQEKAINSLQKLLEEHHGRYWALEQIIKYTGNLESFDKLMNLLTDMLIGIMGVDTASIYVKSSNNNSFKCYYRSIYNNNIFVEEDDLTLPDFMLRIAEPSIYSISNINKRVKFIKGENVNSVLFSPLKDFKKNDNFGIIIVEHNKSEYFNSQMVSFFNTLSTQIAVVAENSRLFDRISDLTNKDILTNCYNRKYFYKLLDSVTGGKKHYSLALFDCDNFKKINDIYGHLVGDDVLVSISDLAISYTNKYGGEVIRYGGDEFIIILYRPIEEAVEILNRFRIEVNDCFEFVKDKVLASVTISISSYPETVSSADDLLSVADKALIRSKKIRKNSITIAYENPTSSEDISMELVY